MEQNASIVFGRDQGLIIPDFPRGGTHVKQNAASEEAAHRRSHYETILFYHISIYLSSAKLCQFCVIFVPRFCHNF